MDILINVNNITSIKIKPKMENYIYEWLPSVPEKRIFFGLYKINDGYKEGFYEFGEYGKSWIVECSHKEIDDLYPVPYSEIRLEYINETVSYYE